MEIQRIDQGSLVELRLAGRLDEYGTQRLSTALEAALAAGARRLRLDMCQISYLGSSGVGVLVRYQQRLQQAGGTLAVAAASEPVRRILDMARLGMLLDPEAAAAPPPQPARSLPEIAIEAPRLELQPLAAGAALHLRALGDPDLLAGRLFKEKDVLPLRPPQDGFALGLGAFGRDFNACRHRFGEFLAAGGEAVYQPCDGSNVPDYLPTASDLLTLYSLLCEGGFRLQARFEASRDGAAVTLAGLVAACVAATAAPWSGILLVAETPVGAGAAPVSCLAAGVAVRAPHPQATALLRPQRWSSYPAGRFHAACFQHSCPDPAVGPGTAARMLLQSGTLREVAIPSPDLTCFVRGACWLGPIERITTERA